MDENGWKCDKRKQDGKWIGVTGGIGYERGYIPHVFSGSPFSFRMNLYLFCFRLIRDGLNYLARKQPNPTLACAARPRLDPPTPRACCLMRKRAAALQETLPVSLGVTRTPTCCLPACLLEGLMPCTVPSRLLACAHVLMWALGLLVLALPSMLPSLCCSSRLVVCAYYCKL
jgi:hypothetical protein